MRHIKWIEFLQFYTFIVKHKKGTNNKVEDALSRRLLIVQEFKLQSIDLDDFKDMYEENTNFLEAYKVCTNFANHFHSEFPEYTL